MKFVHISDLHVGEHGTRNSLVKKLVDKIIKHYSSEREKPVVLITGDLVHDGRQEQFNEADQLLFKLKNAGFQLLMCPGNHDYGETGLDDDYQARQRYNQFAMKLITRESDPDSGVQNIKNGQWNYPIVNKYDDVYFVGLDTMQGVFRLSWYYRFLAKFTAAGWLGQSQLTKLESIIKNIRQKSSDATIILYMHHHPFNFNFRFRVMKLHDRLRLHKIIKNQVNILLFGHNHVEKRLWDKQKQNGIGIVQVFGTSTHNRHTPFYEIDTETRKMKKI